MSDLPVPSESGVSGTQVAGPIMEHLSAQPTPTHGLLMAETMDFLAATRSRNLGGEIGARLLSASFAEISHNLTVTREDLRERDDQLRNTQNDLGNAKATIAVLRERVGAIGRVQHLKQLSVFAGTVLMGVAIDLYKSNIEKTSYLLGTVGLILLIAGSLDKRVGVDE